MAFSLRRGDRGAVVFRDKNIETTVLIALILAGGILALLDKTSAFLGSGAYWNRSLVHNT